MAKQSRLETMRLITGQHHIMTNSPKLTAIYGEFNLVKSAESSTYGNKWLLIVLYTTRALDTCLSEIISNKHWHVESNQKNLNGYFTIMAQHHVLTGNQHSDFKRSLVYPRNKYLHQAGQKPSNVEANEILSEMHACLAFVLQKT